MWLCWFSTSLIKTVILEMIEPDFQPLSLTIVKTWCLAKSENIQVPQLIWSNVFYLWTRGCILDTSLCRTARSRMDSCQSVFQTLRNKDGCMQIILLSCGSIFNVDRYIINCMCLYFKRCQILRFFKFVFSLSARTQKRTVRLILQYALCKSWIMILHSLMYNWFVFSLRRQPEFLKIYHPLAKKKEKKECKSAGIN